MATEDTQAAEMEATLRGQAVQVDAGTLDKDAIPSTTIESVKRATDPAAPEAEPAKPADASSSGTDPVKEKPEEKPTDEVKDDPKDSRFVKNQKEKERADRSWSKLNEEKAALKAEREAYEKSKAAPVVAQPEKIEAVSTSGKVHDGKGNTAEDYAKFAKECEAAGDAELAKAALDMSGKLKAQEGQAVEREQKAALDASWNAEVEAKAKEFPDLADPKTPMGLAVQQVITENPELYYVKNGFSKAVALHQLREQAGKVPELLAQVQKLTKETERLNKLTSLGGSNPTAPAASKAFADLADADQERMLRTAAQEADKFATV